MGKRERKDFEDAPADGEGTLILMLSDKESIKIGETRVHLNYIHHTGRDGGNREVSLAFIGPKTVKIDRLRRIRGR